MHVCQNKKDAESELEKLKNNQLEIKKYDNEIDNTKD
mgnify:CR=1 FL=1